MSEPRDVMERSVDADSLAIVLDAAKRRASTLRASHVDANHDRAKAIMEAVDRLEIGGKAMNEPEITAGTRVWVRHIAVNSNNPRFPMMLVRTDDPHIPDHPALKPLVEELERQGPEARTVTLSASDWDAAVKLIALGLGNLSDPADVTAAFRVAYEIERQTAAAQKGGA